MENYGYKKWGIAFGIFGFIHGLISFMWSLASIYLPLMSSTAYFLNSSISYGITTIATITFIVIGVFAVLGLLYSILGVVGWSRKKLSVTGIVFNTISIVITTIIAIITFGIQLI